MTVFDADVLSDPGSPSAASAEPLLEVTDLEVSFPSEDGRVRAVRGISYRLEPGEVLGIVGESGSGKSVSSLAVMGLLPPSARISGSIRLRGKELLGLSDSELSRFRGRRISMVFQDPLSALTPVYSVGDQIAEALLVHAKRSMTARAARRRAVELLDLVGIPNAGSRVSAFPHEFSGGMRQRAVIAMAIANAPDLIIADEPTTALDVTVQAQVLEVLKTAREVTGAGIVLITHDLGVVAGNADRVVVMYAGRAVETGTVDEIFATPRMPYTLGLLGSIPRLDIGRGQPLVPVEGNPPSLVRPAARLPVRPALSAARGGLRRGGADAAPRAGAGTGPPRRPAFAPPSSRGPTRRRATSPPRSTTPPPWMPRPPTPSPATSARSCWASTTSSSTSRCAPAALSGAPWAPCAPSTASASTCGRARRSAWSVSPAAASPRRSWRSWGWSHPWAARSRCSARTSRP